MNGSIEIKPMDRGRRDCKCVPRCKEYFKICGFDAYCKKELEQLAFNILNTVNGINIMQGNHTSNGWTVLMEKKLIDYIETYGVQNGTYSKLAVILNKKRTQVKAKVYQLEKQGRLKFEKVTIKKKASDAANGG